MAKETTSPTPPPAVLAHGARRPAPCHSDIHANNQGTDDDDGVVNRLGGHLVDDLEVALRLCKEAGVCTGMINVNIGNNNDDAWVAKVVTK